MFESTAGRGKQNPFAGTRELNGLKIMMMLVSNWDNKDVRDVARGSNNAIFEHRLADGTVEARYLIIDWGATMGKWGSPITRTKWDCEGYASQNSEFVLGVEGGVVKWGYTGQRRRATKESRSKSARLYRYVGRITDGQRAKGDRSGGRREETAHEAVRETHQQPGRGRGEDFPAAAAASDYRVQTAAR